MGTSTHRVYLVKRGSRVSGAATKEGSKRFVELNSTGFLKWSLSESWLLQGWKIPLYKREDKPRAGFSFPQLQERKVLGFPE